MPGLQSINGIMSGLDTDTIVSKIMELARKPVTDLQSRQKDLTSKLSAWQEFNTRLLALQIKASSIASPTQFDARSVTSSDEDILTATAGSTAAAGTYYVKVISTAQSHQVASQGFANLTDSVGIGSVTISLANDTSFSVDIDENNNSLTGLRDAINNANSGVTAVIVNSGDADAPYKLLLTSDSSGTDYAMTVNTSGLDNPNRPVLDQQVQAALDATLELGTGAGKISITKSTNTINDVIPGVTLNLNGADAGKTITLKVNVDTAAMQKTVEDFVTQYNNIVDFMESQFVYNPQSSTIGVLFGNYQLQTLQADLASAMLNPVAGLAQSTKTLSQVGITMGQDGKLSIDTTELQGALKSKLSEVKNIFSVGFDSPNSTISYISNTSDTKASSSLGYAVSVTQAAVRASTTSGVAQNAPLSQKETLTINGKTIILQADWTQQQVVDEINVYSRTTGIQASATGAGGVGTGNYLTLTHLSYGSTGHVTARSGVSSSSGNNSGIGNIEITEAAAAGESLLGTGVLGKEMIGTINGIAAKAQGQYLIGQPGADGKNPANGLKLRIDSTGPLTSTARFTKGVAAMVRDLAMQVTDADGSVGIAEDSLNKEIADIGKQITSWDVRLAAKQDKLYVDFNAMEDALSKLQTQGNALAALLGTTTTTT